MEKFSNKQYKYQVYVLMKDIFESNMSYDGKITRIRTYSEIVIRKMLGIPQTEKMTIGGKKVKKLIEKLPYHSDRKRVFDSINKPGTGRTHTERKVEESEEEFEKASKEQFDEIYDALLNLMAFLFIDYFYKYKFGTNLEVLYSFSLLPPVLRYKVLTFLYRYDADNVYIVDKLALAILKTYGKKAAFLWLEKNKDNIQRLNMYDSCLYKVNIINSKGIYLDFKSAQPYYEKYGVLEESKEENKEFNDIMNFIYMRKKEDEPFLDKGPQIYYRV